MSVQVKHEARVFYGEWHVLAYCTAEGCGWKGAITNLWDQDARDGDGNNHDDRARLHERQMNGLSRTEMGYAFWKEIPTVVRDAREFARAHIAIAKLKREVLVIPLRVMEWIIVRFNARGNS